MLKRKTATTAMDTVPRQKPWTHRAGSAAAPKSMGRASIQARSGRIRRAVLLLPFRSVDADVGSSGWVGDGWVGDGTVPGTTSDSVVRPALVASTWLPSVAGPDERAPELFGR